MQTDANLSASGEKVQTNTNVLALARTASGLTMRALAVMSGVDKATISQLENGKRRAQRATLYKLAVALDIDLNHLDDLLDASASARGKQGAATRLRARQDHPRLPSPRQSRARSHFKAKWWVVDDDFEVWPAASEADAVRLASKFTLATRVYGPCSKDAVFDAHMKFMTAMSNKGINWRANKRGTQFTPGQGDPTARQ